MNRTQPYVPFFRYVSCVIRVLSSATGVFCTSFVSTYLPPVHVTDPTEMRLKGIFFFSSVTFCNSNRRMHTVLLKSQ
jgi:hypothetical protein